MATLVFPLVYKVHRDRKAHKATKDLKAIKDRPVHKAAKVYTASAIAPGMALNSSAMAGTRGALQQEALASTVTATDYTQFITKTAAAATRDHTQAHRSSTRILHDHNKTPAMQGFSICWL